MFMLAFRRAGGGVALRAGRRRGRRRARRRTARRYEAAAAAQQGTQQPSQGATANDQSAPTQSDTSSESEPTESYIQELEKLHQIFEGEDAAIQAENWIHPKSFLWKDFPKSDGWVHFYTATEPALEKMGEWKTNMLLKGGGHYNVPV